MSTRKPLLRTFFFALCLLLLSPEPALANVAARFDWQTVWGTILPDTGIPSGSFNVKGDIARAVQLCGTSTNYSKIPTYAVDVNGDGLSDYVDSAYPYFSSVSETCPISMCSASQGCNLSIYLHESVTQILTEKPEKDAQQCPKNASDNKTCLSYCPAARTNCPALFEYHSTGVWDAPVINWEFIPVITYNAMRAANLTPEDYFKYRLAFNNNHVLKATRASSLCTFEERDRNNDGVVSASEPCVKYYQFAYDRFIDMYSPMASDLPAKAENDNRYTYVEFSRDVAMVDSTEQKNWRKSEDQVGMDNTKLMADGGFFGFQIKNYTGKDKPVALFCREYKNESKNTYFVPTRTDFEIEAFDKAVIAHNVTGVTGADCERKYTSWFGQTSCPPLACGETVTIAAERRCQRSSSAYGACNECDGEKDLSPIYNSSNNKCFFSQICVGPPCVNSNDCLPGTAKILMADGSTKPISSITAGEKVMGFKKNAPRGVLSPAKIVEIHATDKSPLIQINDMKISRGHAVINGDGHPMIAGDIQKGDIITGISGERVQVEKAGPVEDNEAVFNFVLEDADGFVVDGTRVLAQKPRN